MGDFKRRDGKRFSGGGGFNRRDNNRSGFGGDRDRGPVVMHQAICAECGKPCEVPFKPTSGRPVYCSDCFGGKKEAGGNRDRFPQKNYDGQRDSGRPGLGNDAGKGNDYELRKQLEVLNTKMDRLIRAAEIMAKIKPLATEEKTKEIIKIGPVAKAKKSAKKASKK